MGYLRRSVSPGGDTSPIQIVEVTFPAGARVEGTIDFSIGADSYRLRAGDCLVSRLDRPTMFHDPTAKAARYAVVMVAEPVGRR